MIYKNNRLTNVRRRCMFAVLAAIAFPVASFAQTCSQIPKGSMDEPNIQRDPVLSGAVNVTGWALSAYSISQVAIYRDPVPGEPTQANGLVFIQNATLAPGARPDVAQANPECPNNDWGWGTQVLTNSLPAAGSPPRKGNGTYRLHAIASSPLTASDPINYPAIDISQATMFVDNFTSTKPFGTIDTPDNGGTASGTQFVNFGWALTPLPKTIPRDGSTITTTIDYIGVAHPVYNQFRSDIHDAFPELNNSMGAVGYSILDTTHYSAGAHAIGWNVYDDTGIGEGIGSRIFTIVRPAVTQVRGGSVLATWPTQKSRCVSPYGYYMPLRVYDDGNYKLEIDSVLASNYLQGARTVTLPIYYVNDGAPDACDSFIVPTSGPLQGVPPANLTANLTNLMNTLHAQGYSEVLLFFAPTGAYYNACENITQADKTWCGDASQWNNTHDTIYQANLTFINNVLNYAFNSANNAGLVVRAVLPENSLQVDNDCSKYLAGTCGSSMPASYLNHTWYGLQAKFATMLWDALASETFSNGISGKNQIYGYETGNQISSANLQNILTMYTATSKPQNRVWAKGLYDETMAGRPNLTVLGNYPDPPGYDGYSEFMAMHNTLNQAGVSNGVIIMETRYNNASVAQGYANGVTASGRSMSFLTQWPCTLCNGANVVPWNINNYYIFGF